MGRQNEDECRQKWNEVESREKKKRWSVVRKEVEGCVATERWHLPTTYMKEQVPSLVRQDSPNFLWFFPSFLLACLPACLMACRIYRLQSPTRKLITLSHQARTIYLTELSRARIERHVLEHLVKTKEPCPTGAVFRGTWAAAAASISHRNFRPQNLGRQSICGWPWFVDYTYYATNPTIPNIFKVLVI